MNVRTEETFEFQPVSSLEVWNDINQLNRSKKTSGDLSTDIVKSISGSCLEYFTFFVNQMVANSTFPDKLKLADVSPILKLGDSFFKKNFRPISVLSSISKIFERLMSKQNCPFAYRRLSNLLCGFRNGHSAEHALFRLTEICRKALADKKVVGMVLMDLSKAYDCLPHDLLIAKLAAYGFSHHSLLLIHGYLSNRKQRVKVGSEFSEWLGIESGVPQGSELGPLFFNIFINDLLLAVKDSEVCNFADDTTIYTFGKDIEDVVLNLEEDLSNTLDWFRDYHMAANPGKFQVMFLGLREKTKFILEINDQIIPLTDKVKLLGVTIDSQLKFDDHVKALCQKANRKVSAFSRVAPYLNHEKGKILYNTFVMSNFNYCPLIWMYHGKTSNSQVDRVQKGALRILHNDFNTQFEVLLEITDERKVHTKNCL